ncbi:nuclear transport factor 2 family protein [Rhodococcus sp. SGAir0479]|uniref:nuclear transport factor 2 family protein n=1 Tax=Rhodococcus sp. SGAir0479 TaxID=2567884 RepID=UPI0010CD5A20|nr:nuclear transport factor 2 family protein [Rhodococcus sp. SGAir0479]QCQ91071.1 nuclear transport factor 2 family protein [Rhodococcus sp. SGAir0479]
MIIRKSLVAAGVLAAALGMTACGSDDSSDQAETTATTTSATTGATTSTAASAAAPSAEVLQEQLTTFFDPAVPAAEKSEVIENGAQRTATLEQFNQVLAGYPLTAKVGEVTAAGDTVTATTEIAGPHGGAPVPVTFTESNGEWVISDASSCQIFGMGRVSC